MEDKFIPSHSIPSIDYVWIDGMRRNGTEWNKISFCSSVWIDKKRMEWNGTWWNAFHLIPSLTTIFLPSDLGGMRTWHHFLTLRFRWNEKMALFRLKISKKWNGTCKSTLFHSIPLRYAFFHSALFHSDLFVLRYPNIALSSLLYCCSPFTCINKLHMLLEFNFIFCDGD